MLNTRYKNAFETDIQAPTQYKNLWRCVSFLFVSLCVFLLCDLCYKFHLFNRQKKKNDDEDRVWKIERNEDEDEEPIYRSTKQRYQNTNGPRLR